MKKTWQAKLEDKSQFPKVLIHECGFPCYNAVHKMGAEAGDEIVLANPSEIVAIMKKVPQGKLITISEICGQLAKKHGVKACWTLTTGIFIMTAANAVAEASEMGQSLEIPYWRTLKADGSLNDKYPGGQESQKSLLEQEGFTVIQRGKKYWVLDFQQYVI
ncbi:MAG: MGMT family protein [Bacteroidia bacterium]|nr:MGMT family protein [Bacteroidia bacterium]